MSLIPWKGKQRDGDLDETTASPLAQFRTEVDRLFDRFFGGAWGLAREGFGRGSDWMPSLDISESDTDITVRAEVPGVDPKDLDIQVAGQVLTVSGEKKETTEAKGEDFYRTERCFGSFRRSVQLPRLVDCERISAEHKNGVLLIRLPKRESAVPRRIPIKSSE